MRLCYRGVEYDYSPPSLEVRESEMTGRYRGKDLRFSYVRHIPFPQPVADLTYRGVPYHANANGQTTPVEKAVEAKQARFALPTRQTSAAVQARRALLQEAAKAHQESIQRSLQHRLAVAKAQGNQTLVNQLEQEMHQLA